MLYLFRRLAFGLALLPFFASADPLQTPGDRDLIRDRQERLLQEQRKRLQELQSLPGRAAPQVPASTPEDTRCFTIRHIVLEGAEHLGEREQRRLLEPYEGQCLGVGQLNALLKVVTDHYLNRGYITTRAYLPQQDLSSGTLQITVVEGRLDGLDSSSLASPRELAMAFPGTTGEVLNLRELEQLVDQLTRLPSRQAQLELVPGDEVGSSRVQLQGQRDKPWRVSATRNNDGDRSSGEQQMGLGLDWDSPLGLADQFSLRANQDAVSDHWRHSDSQYLNYSVPWGWWTFTYSYNQSYYRTRDDSSGFPFKLDGDSQMHQLRVERVIHRDALSKTAVNLGISHLRTNNYLDDSLIDVSSTRLSESQLGVNHGRRIGTAFLNLDAGWQQGIGAFDAQGAGDPHGTEPVARYNKYSLTLSYLQPFTLWGEAFSFDSLATGQRSEDPLYSPQRISVGGLNSVRGFKQQTLTGNSGGYWRNQLRWRRPVSWAPLQPFVQEYGAALAYDVGVIKGDHNNPDTHGRLSGNAVELNLRGQYFAASVSFARSLQRPDSLERREHPIYVRMDAFF
ncbi:MULTISPECIES: ShlB/FhaC/HecB family hemolysin secretion/activation protein [Pseudomonas]|jgi:hemolysin activation/secretion protein|uniref:Hemolysin activation/secretion protein n=1 Tax=Pseudomonas putida TaxID=303 RepID=A0A9X8EJJ3_PSEPU|nr:MULTISPECIES: ShlB/FhaC/HecB family hemolysin secretion/activation protein [Pseudomonas]MCO7504905.1 ShlB/FhaC/HecB family hemolysin secretion/activation protein [Pseudomonas sp. VE 267-6A]MCO7531296.1 ShlB/FhaC/HecB family hemolysin secretion/activation protein [Pseudomonas sp. 2]OOW04682.1 ShlB family hemolysin secretion/activation protein [Pseudomonas sp. MF6396]PPS63418.1 ShlB/FhaC/HecB family hemolysin secretion/activation protein [Pseudomonas sp. BRM28]ROQ49556.1 hemolysin activation/